MNWNRGNVLCDSENGWKRIIVIRNAYNSRILIKGFMLVELKTKRNDQPFTCEEYNTDG